VHISQVFFGEGASNDSGQCGIDGAFEVSVTVCPETSEIKKRP